MTRYLIAFALAASLSACGFHLRNKITLPDDAPAVKVESAVNYSELVKLLERGLRASGAVVSEEDGVGVAKLKIRSERWGDLPIAIDGQGRAQEYRMRYATIFVFKRADGTDLVPQQVIELSRDYVAPPTDATGTTTEREILAAELRREMAASILRRIDGVVRSQAGNAPQDSAREDDAPVR